MQKFQQKIMASRNGLKSYIYILAALQKVRLNSVCAQKKKQSCSLGQNICCTCILLYISEASDETIRLTLCAIRFCVFQCIRLCTKFVENVERIQLYFSCTTCLFLDCYKTLYGRL